MQRSRHEVIIGCIVFFGLLGDNCRVFRKWKLSWGMARISQSGAFQAVAIVSPSTKVLFTSPLSFETLMT